MRKAIKIILLTILFGICALLIWRCCIYADKSKFSSPEATDAVKAAFSENGEVSAYSIKIHRENSENGYFSAYGFYWFREAEEAQLAVRWNDSAYEYTNTGSGYEFSFCIRNETTGEKYPASVAGTARAVFYNYRKLVFEGLTINENDELSLVMYVDNMEVDACAVKHAEQGIEGYSLPGSFLRSLSQ